MYTHKPIAITPATRIDDNGFRKYRTPGGKSYPSITTVISKTSDKTGLKKWQNTVGESVANYIMTTAASTGTNVHDMIEDDLHNRPFKNGKPTLLEKAHFDNMQPALSRITNIRGTEVRLYSDELELAGTCDLVAEYSGVLSIIDYKCKRSKPYASYDTVKGYFEQATAYALMWKERTGTPISQVVIIASDEKGGLTVFVKKVEDYAPKLLERLERFRKL